MAGWIQASRRCRTPARGAGERFPKAWMQSARIAMHIENGLSLARAHFPTIAVWVPRIHRKESDSPRPSDPIETDPGCSRSVLGAIWPPCSRPSLASLGFETGLPSRPDRLRLSVCSRSQHRPHDELSLHTRHAADYDSLNRTRPSLDRQTLPSDYRGPSSSEAPRDSEWQNLR